MYLQKIKLENIKCFENLELDFMQGRDNPRLMTVVLGDNGIGKTTLLQTMAITLGGLQLVRIPFSKKADDWTRIGHQRGLIDGFILPGKSDQNSPGRTLEIDFVVTNRSPHNQSKISIFDDKDRPDLEQTLYARDTKGWLACGYGPLRRFTSQRVSLIEYNKISRLASLFGENEHLIPIEDWLIELDRRALIAEREGKSSNDRRLAKLIIQAVLKILPLENSKQAESVDLANPLSHIKITAEGIRWLDNFGNWVTLSQLSDGYQSTMSWIGDLVTRLSHAFPDADNLLEQEGIVLIDEVDIHLHPTWQRKILHQLRRTFPNIQFIVTTHSPLVAASANEGELFVLKKEQDQVVLEPGTSVQGWRADQILTSPLFGLETTRAPETERQLARYDELLIQKARGQLSTTAAQELADLEEALRETLPPPGEIPEQRDLQQQMEDYIKQTLTQK